MSSRKIENLISGGPNKSVGSRKIFRQNKKGGAYLGTKSIGCQERANLALCLVVFSKSLKEVYGGFCQLSHRVNAPARAEKYGGSYANEEGRSVPFLAAIECSVFPLCLKSLLSVQ